MEGQERANASCKSHLARIRRLEAVSFRAFPSASLQYFGTWAVRLTAGHPAKRLNSVTPLDPNDTGNIESRLERVARRFSGYGRDLIFRQTPLAPKALEQLLVERRWRAFEESLVMVAPLTELDFSEVVDQVPLQDIGRWVSSFLALSGQDISRKAGLVEVLSSIEARAGLFLTETRDGNPVSSVRSVCDGDLVGIFELETDNRYRRLGHARNLLASALKSAASNGAGTAWLQVVASNVPAIALYRSFGFRELYSYRYWQKPL
jgi:ribosomal protein S18 acetylase RimI-like enzyme